MTTTEYRLQPCGLKKKVEVFNGRTGISSLGLQPEGCCPHAFHAGTMFFEHSKGTAKTIGWRCEMHTSARWPGPDWRRVRLLDPDLCSSTEGRKGWEYVAHESGDA